MFKSDGNVIHFSAPKGTLASRGIVAFNALALHKQLDSRVNGVVTNTMHRLPAY